MDINLSQLWDIVKDKEACSGHYLVTEQQQNTELNPIDKKEVPQKIKKPKQMFIWSREFRNIIDPN